MKTPSFLARRDYDRIRASTRTLVDRAGGPVFAAREIVRVDAARLSRYGAPHETCFIPIDVVADLEAEVVSHGGEPIVTRELADLAGYLLVPKPTGRGDPDWLRRAARVIRECAEVSGAIGLALADDGCVGPTEAAEILERVRGAMEQLAAVEDAAKRLVGEVRHARAKGGP